MSTTRRIALACSLLLGSALAATAAANNGGASGANGQNHDWGWRHGCSMEQAMTVAHATGLRDMRMAHAGESRFVIVGTMGGEPTRMVLNRETETCKILSLASL